MAILFPGFFRGLIVMSPSLWWDRRVVLRHLRKHDLEPLPRTWIDAGRKEGSTVTRDAQELHKLLRRQKPGAVRYIEDPRGDHSEASWGRRLPDALEWIYRG
jgi:predicted alpha/beta superfamily hydrolase